jgi:hypothetical protein
MRLCVVCVPRTEEDPCCGEEVECLSDVEGLVAERGRVAVEQTQVLAHRHTEKNKHISGTKAQGEESESVCEDGGRATEHRRTRSWLPASDALDRGLNDRTSVVVSWTCLRPLYLQ